MSKRYSKLFALSGNLYTSSAPVVILAGALLKDNQTDKVLAQLKIQNIGTKPIKAVTVCIHPLDTVGNPLGNKILHQYLDLSAARDAEFGAKSPVMLPNTATRGFSVSVVEVAFADNTVWKSSDTPWESMSAPMLLSDAMKDLELVKQYRLQYGNAAKFCVHCESDVWLCTCGAINRNTEISCHKCGVRLKDLLAFDVNILKKARDMRLSTEVAQAQVTKTRKTRKRFILSGVCIIAILAAILGFINFQKVSKYNQAVEYTDNAQYLLAIEAFTALGDYSDSINRLSEVKKLAYDEVFVLLDKCLYDDALYLCEGLGEYSDCPEIAEQIESELITYAEIVSASIIDSSVIEEANRLISDGQYIKDQNFAQIVNIFSLLCDGEWEYISGDASALAVKSKTEYHTITTDMYRKEGWQFAQLYIYFGEAKLYLNGKAGSSIFTQDIYSGVDFTVKLTEEAHLLIEAEYIDGTIASCEYQRCN